MQCEFFNAISKKNFRYSQLAKRIIAIEAQLYFLGLVGLQMPLKEGRQKPYGHDLTKISHILLQINHIVFKKTVNTIVPNEWLYQIPSCSDVAAKLEYITHSLID